MRFTLLLLSIAFFFTACEHRQAESHPMPDHNEDWAVFSSGDAASPSIVTVDLGWQAALPVEAFSQSLQVRVKAEEVLANGFPTEWEVNLANSLQDALIRALERQGLGIFAGSRTGDGEKMLAFYLRPLPASEGLVREVVQGFSSRPVEIHVEADPSWHTYLERLMPNGREMSEVQNERILYRLQKAGDRLAQPRPVSHSAYFPDAKQRRLFLDTLQDAGFEIMKLDTLPEGSEKPFGAQVSRVDSIHVPYIHKLSWGIAECTRRHGGAYDGWETILVRD